MAPQIDVLCFGLTISRWLKPRPNAIKECRMTANCVESDHCHCRASLRKRPQKIHPRVSYQPVQIASLIYRSGTAFGNWPGREWFHNGCLGEPTSQDSERPLAQSSCFSKFSFFWFSLVYLDDLGYPDYIANIADLVTFSQLICRTLRLWVTQLSRT